MAHSEKLNEQSESSGKKKLQGKYLASLVNYVATLNFDARWIVSFGPELETLKDCISKVFSPHLTADDVETIVVKHSFRIRTEGEGRTGAFTDPKNEDVRIATVAWLKAYFESIPRLCTLRIDLPQFPLLDFDLLDLAPDIKLIAPQLTKNALLANALRGDAVSDFGVRPQLQIVTRGYGDYTMQSGAASDCLSVAKQFAFALVDSGVTLNKYSMERAGAAFSDGEGELFTAIEVPEGVGKYLGRLCIDERKMLMYERLEPGPTRSPLFGLDVGRAPGDARERRLALSELFTEVRRFFAARSNEDFGQIAAAIEWYQDSRWSDNDTFAYIAACVGLEAILGSKDESLDSLTKRLGDRYAFLMGKGRADREALRRRYHKVLEVRGQLVHGKAARLPREERGLLQEAQTMLALLIRRELFRIKGEESASQAAADAGHAWPFG